jgi:hypothetical protein
VKLIDSDRENQRLFPISSLSKAKVRKLYAHLKNRMLVSESLKASKVVMREIHRAAVAGYLPGHWIVGLGMYKIADDILVLEPQHDVVKLQI